MAIGPSLGELTGLIQDPGPIQYRDFGLDEHEAQRQKLLMQRAQLGDERAKVQLQAMLQRQAEQGRNARADQRMGLQREKFGFEQKKFGAENDERRRGQLEAAYAQLRDAQDRGDAQGVSFARQAIERLGETVEGGQQLGTQSAAPVPGSTVDQPEPPPAPVTQDSPLSVLSGIPRPKAARVGAPPSEMHPGGSQTAGMAAQGRNPPSLGANEPPVYLPESGGPAGGPLPQLPPATSFMAPEAGGAVTSGLAHLGGRIPPRDGPPVSPEPVQLEESSASAPQAAGFSKVLPGAQPVPPDQNPGGLAALGQMYYPKPQAPEPPAQQAAPAPADALPAPAQPAPSAAPPGLRVLRGDKPVLELGGADAPNQVRTTLQSLADNARTPEEKRSAKIAMDTALGAVQRLGVKEAVDIGLKAYDREQNNNRKTRIGTGKGVGDTGFGGSGRTKDELAIDSRDIDRYDNMIKLTTQKYGLNTEVMKADSALSSVEAAMNSNTGTGQLAAVTKALKAMGNTGAMSDRDLNRIMESSGIWNAFKNIVSKAESGTLPPELMENLKGMTGQLRSVIRQKRQEAAEDARLGIMNDPGIYGDRESLANAAAGFFSGYAQGSVAPNRGKKKPQPGASGAAAPPARQGPAPAGGVPSKYQRLF